MGLGAEYLYMQLLLLVILWKTVDASNNTIAYQKSGVQPSSTNRVKERLTSHCLSRGLPFVDCTTLPPCRAQRMLGKHCERHPEALCRNDYCGGCVARHYGKDGTELSCERDDSVICELHNTSISCPVNSVISVIQANFGRTDMYTCRHSYDVEAMHGNTRCYSRNATSIVKDSCSGKMQCWPGALTSMYGDPCHGIYKYLRVEYECISIENFLQLRELEAMSAQMAAYSSAQSSLHGENMRRLHFYSLIFSLIFVVCSHITSL